MPSYWIDPGLTDEQEARGHYFAARSPFEVSGIFVTEFVFPHDVGVWVQRTVGPDPTGCIDNYYYLVCTNPATGYGTIDYFMGECGTPVVYSEGVITGGGSMQATGYEGNRISGGGNMKALGLTKGLNLVYMGPYVLDEGVVIDRIVPFQSISVRHNFPQPMPASVSSGGRPNFGQIYPR